jgi:acyl carrier protein
MDSHATTLDVEEIISKVDDILINEFELDDEGVVPEARLREDLDLDSLDGVDLVIALEKTFGIRLEDEELLEMKTVGDIHAHIRAHYGKSGVIQDPVTAAEPSA